MRSEVGKVGKEGCTEWSTRSFTSCIKRLIYVICQRAGQPIASVFRPHTISAGLATVIA